MMRNIRVPSCVKHGGGKGKSPVTVSVCVQDVALRHVRDTGLTQRNNDNDLANDPLPVISCWSRMKLCSRTGRVTIALVRPLEDEDLCFSRGGEWSLLTL